MKNETNRTTNNLFSSRDSMRDAMNCSLIAQHGASGRLGRTTFYSRQAFHDRILAFAFCRSQGIGMSTNESELNELAKMSTECGHVNEMENEKGEHETTVMRARSCLAGIKLTSRDMKKKQEWIKVVESSAKANDAYGLFLLGVEHYQGVNFRKDEKKARYFIKESESSGLSYVTSVVLPIVSKGRLKPENREEWDTFVYHLHYNTILTTLDLNGDGKKGIMKQKKGTNTIDKKEKEQITILEQKELE